MQQCAPMPSPATRLTRCAFVDLRRTASVFALLFRGFSFLVEQYVLAMFHWIPL
jgi:hypothetical protein